MNVLKEFVYVFFQETLKPFSKNVCIFPREVASKEESSIWRNRPSVKQAILQKEKGNCMNRASKMGGSLSRKMLLRKKVDYQEEGFLKEE